MTRKSSAFAHSWAVTPTSSLAPPLGGTESLASHPAAMPAEVRDRIGVLDTTIEHADDLIADLAQALAVTA